MEIIVPPPAERPFSGCVCHVFMSLIHLGIVDHCSVEQSGILRENACGRRKKIDLDFILFDKVILEIKAPGGLHDKHRAEVHNYLKGTGLRVGLFVDFGAHPQLEHDRLT
jgi:GxxExxY protein